jgi:uncharacterized protein
MEQLQREVYDFPTLIPLKVIGRNQDEFEHFVVSLFHQHVEEPGIEAVFSRPSRGDAYLSVTVTFMARSREHLDAIYHALSLDSRILMVI